MKQLLLVAIAIVVAVSGCVESPTFEPTTTTQVTSAATTSIITTTAVSSSCTGFSYFSFQSQQLKSDGTYTIELLNGNESVSIISMLIYNNFNEGPIEGNRQPVGSEKFSITGTYPSFGIKGEKFSFKVSVNYKPPDFVTRTDIATCTGTIE